LSTRHLPNFMQNLSTEQLLYLLYAFAYTEEDKNSVTQGTVKRYLPKVYHTKAMAICKELLEKNLLDSPQFRRVTLSESGKQSLVFNLQTTDYRFTTVKGSRVVNALMECLKLAASLDSSEDNGQTVELSFEEFIEKFKTLYFQERKQQSLQGTYVIREKDILSKFSEQTGLSNPLLKQHYERLKSEGIVSAVQGREDNNIQWIE